MLGNFDDNVQVILMKAKDEMMGLNHPYVGSEHLLLSILKNDSEMALKLKDYNLTYDNFRNEIIKIIGVGSKKSTLTLYTPMLKKVISNAMLDSKDNNDGTVTVMHLFSALLECGEGIAIRLLIGMNIDVDLLYNDFCNKIVKRSRGKNKKSLLDEFGVDLNKLARDGKIDPVVGRDKEVERVIEILGRKNKNNPLLLGDAGVGKTAIVEHIATMIENGRLPNLIGKRIINLSMSSMVSGTKYRGEFEEKMQKLIRELEGDDSIILFIDEIHTLVGAGGAEGAIDASNILKPALARGSVRCIGATTYDEYNKFIAKDKALERRFQKVIVKETSNSETERILFDIKNIYEKFHNVVVDSKLIPSIVSLSNKYVYDRKRPDKAIDILDEVCSMVGNKVNKDYEKAFELEKKLEDIVKKKNSYIVENNIKKAYECLKLESIYQEELNSLRNIYNNKTKNVTIEDIAMVISNKYNVSISDVLKNNISIIDNLKKSFSNKVIGQDKAVNSLLNIGKRIKFGYDNKVKSIMFVGSSGVGKTYLAEIFAKEMVGDDGFLRLDMSEFSDSTAVNKFLGSSAGYVGYDDSNYLDEIKKRPNGLILFDEIDKAHSSVINLLYQILDYGKIKDNKGNEVRFDNNIIIFTSNIGYNENIVGFDSNVDNNVISKLNEYFGVAFVNRIDDIIAFNSLTKDNIIDIIGNKLIDLKNKYNSLDISWVDNEVDTILKKCDYEKYGARGIDKIIMRDIEGRIIDQIMDNCKIKE